MRMKLNLDSPSLRSHRAIWSVPCLLSSSVRLLLLSNLFLCATSCLSLIQQRHCHSFDQRRFFVFAAHSSLVTSILSHPTRRDTIKSYQAQNTKRSASEVIHDEAISHQSRPRFCCCISHFSCLVSTTSTRRQCCIDARDDCTDLYKLRRRSLRR